MEGIDPRVLGETLDLSKAAEKIVADHDRYFAKVRQENPELTGLTATWAIFYGTGNGLQYLSAPDSAPATFLGELGFAENPRAQEFVTQSTVGEELLENIDADFLLIGRSAAGSEEDFDKLTGGKLFQALGAVSSGHWGWPATAYRGRRGCSMGNHERWPRSERCGRLNISCRSSARSCRHATGERKALTRRHTIVWRRVVRTAGVPGLRVAYGTKKVAKPGVTGPAAGNMATATCPAPVCRVASPGVPWLSPEEPTGARGLLSRGSSSALPSKACNPRPLVFGAGDRHRARLFADYRHTVDRGCVEAAVWVPERRRVDLERNGDRSGGNGCGAREPIRPLWIRRQIVGVRDSSR